ncbi:MAG: hypothetical protein BMS9Abin01_0324 [Gammaproteobacteria bacterium]|nr:MAG: hypothetical protein BMS9Abin01_0324 [Gammaproteobacteria bacterium]
MADEVTEQKKIRKAIKERNVLVHSEKSGRMKRDYG